MVGRELVDNALAALSRRGTQKTHLMVIPGNEGARESWKKLGWIERNDVVLMSKEHHVA